MIEIFIDVETDIVRISYILIQLTQVYLFSNPFSRNIHDLNVWDTALVYMKFKTIGEVFNHGGQKWPIYYSLPYFN